MSGEGLHRALVFVEMGLAAVTFAAMWLVVAPYGRHSRPGWGPAVSPRLGWLLMESPAWLFFAWVYAGGAHRAEAAPLALLALWLCHYLYRGASSRCACAPARGPCRCSWPGSASASTCSTAG